METYQVLLENKISELHKLREALEERCSQWGLPPAVCMSVNLALEEAFANIVNYAFDDQLLHKIELEFSYAGKRLEVVITDDGKPYDPTRQTAPDISLPAEDRPIGGLGIFLIKKIMDEVSYERTSNQNKLYLTKYI
jgi:serine/threonine-protein kinase RsbW